MSKRLRRRLIEAAIFLLMLVVFYLFLRYLTRETTPSEESGSVPRYSAALMTDAAPTGIGYTGPIMDWTTGPWIFSPSRCSSRSS